MRKLAAITAAIFLLPLLTANACEDDKMCEPYAIRRDLTEEHAWWVCSPDGTREDLVKGPAVPHSPTRSDIG